MGKTPFTPEGLRKYDHLSAPEAAARAWVGDGINIAWHRRMQAEVRDAMPVLARHLDRLAEEYVTGRR